MQELGGLEQFKANYVRKLKRTCLKLYALAGLMGEDEVHGGVCVLGHLKLGFPGGGLVLV